MFRIQLSIFAAAFLIVGFFFLATPEYGYSGVDLSLGCCKTSEVGGVCKGCGEEGRCAVDGSLCPETSTFVLGEVCTVSSISGATCKEVETPTGCCINSENTCENDVNFDTCSGQYWFEGTSCSDVPQCNPAPSSNLTDWIIIIIAIVIVVVVLVVYRRKKHTA